MDCRSGRQPRRIMGTEGGAKIMKRFKPAQMSLLLALASFCAASLRAAMPPDYKGRPFEDTVYTKGAQVIPGRIECAFYDLGGEGLTYHDTDAINHGSGELNLKPEHHRPHATPYFWSFRTNEGVDISYTKDFA